MFDGQTIHWVHLTSTDSTNLWARRESFNLPKHALTVIYADMQSLGKGQRNKTWASPPNTGIYASLFFHLPKEFAYPQNLGQTLALSAAKVLQKKGLAIELKWPNDLFVNMRKVGGILTEVFPLADSLGSILGLGINVNTPKEQLDSISQPASSLLLESGEKRDILSLLHKIVEQFIRDFHELDLEGFSSLAQEWQSFMLFLGQSIVFDDREKTTIVTCLGIDAMGSLIVRTQEGLIEKKHSGSILA